MIRLLSSSEEKLRRLDTLFFERNWKDYRTAVHAMKSNARMVGSLAGYERARSLEEAAGKENVSYLRENHALFLDIIGEVVELLKAARN